MSIDEINADVSLSVVVIFELVFSESDVLNSGNRERMHQLFSNHIGISAGARHHCRRGDIRSLAQQQIHAGASRHQCAPYHLS